MTKILFIVCKDYKFDKKYLNKYFDEYTRFVLVFPKFNYKNALDLNLPGMAIFDFRGILKRFSCAYDLRIDNPNIIDIKISDMQENIHCHLSSSHISIVMYN